MRFPRHHVGGRSCDQTRPGNREKEPAAVDPQALAILKRAVDLLAGAGQFSVTAEIWEDVLLENGNIAQTAKTADIKLRRPDRLQVDVKTTKPKRSFFYDGKTLTVVDQQKNYFGATAVPATIDETLNKASEVYGINFPLEDLLLSRPLPTAEPRRPPGIILALRWCWALSAITSPSAANQWTGRSGSRTVPCP